MAGKHLTYRLADGERIPGTWRHAFIRNGSTYFLTDLVIYADGLIDCWGLVTVDEFAEKLRTGWVATELEEGAQASAHDVGGWRFTDVHSYMEPDWLLAEVRDEIERLNGRPTSTERCLTAVDTFLADPTEANRAGLRKAYLEIPESVRRYALGDMDRKDWPLKVLAAGPGGTLPGLSEPVDDEAYAHALDYFAERAEWGKVAERRRSADGPQEPRAAAMELGQVVYPNGWPEDPGPLALRNEYPAPIRVGDVAYPTVAHAYWSLSTDDPEHRAAIRSAENALGARSLAREAPRRAHWDEARPAVMAQLLRAKYEQHPALAEELLRTGDAALLYTDIDSPGYWGQHGRAGRNWMGRLLELVRAELRADRAGLLP